MRVFDFDGTIYDGESLFDLYLFSAKYNPKVLRYIAPVLRYAIKYKLGRATFDQMEYGVGKLMPRIFKRTGRIIGIRRIGQRLLGSEHEAHQTLV